MARIPPPADDPKQWQLNVQQAFRELWEELDKLTRGGSAQDLHGRVMRNAGDPQAASDLVTLRRLQEEMRGKELEARIRSIAVQVKG